MILSLDPSSTCTGYAVFDDAGKPIDAGTLKPDRKADEANTRIIAICRSLKPVVEEHKPTLAIIEDTSGKVGGAARARGANGAGLAIHGKAVGYLMRECVHLLGGEDRVIAVRENDWTQGVPKLIRANRTRYIWPHLATLEDLDALDAVGVGHWWLTMGRHRREATNGRADTVRRIRRRAGR